MFFTEPVLDELKRLPGASHSFAKQLAADDGRPVREMLEVELGLAPPDARDRWSELLSSLDNRRFFQGYSELIATRALRDRGWQLDSLVSPGPSLAMTSPAGAPFHVLVLAFIRQVRLLPDRQMIERLARALNRVGSRSRIAVQVRRWLPHDFDPEPVRRAIDLWLGEVDRGGWEGRYAAYDDDHVSLEFALTGDKAPDERGVVAFTLGPFEAQRVLEALESRIVFELDTHRVRSPDDRIPVVLCAVADQPWRLSPGYLRDMLYGKPRRQTVDGKIESTYCSGYAPSLFRDPVYRNVSGVVLVERPAEDPAGSTSHSFLNPWAVARLEPDAVPGDTLAVGRWEDDCPVVWRFPG